PGDLGPHSSSGPAPPGAVARRRGRRWLGTERDPAYAAAARERIGKVRPLPPAALQTSRPKRAEPRVAFGTIIELGILEAGVTLTDERGGVAAEGRPDGTLAVAGRQGSLPRPGAQPAG